MKYSHSFAQNVNESAPGRNRGCPAFSLQIIALVFPTKLMA
jgi:hypothetical protein